MHIPSEYVYLIATLTFVPIWLLFYVMRKDVRREMLIMSMLVGVLSVVTAYIWWTVDWWRPITLNGSHIGAEDFLMGFFSGGIMSTAYEFFAKERRYKMRKHICYGGITEILAILAAVTALLIHVAHLTSFWASTIALILAALGMFYHRRDLIFNGFLSGVFMLLISILFYGAILILDTQWIDNVYLFEHLSGITIASIPIEEFVFWFLSGLVFGPLYEYWQHDRLRKIRK